MQRAATHVQRPQHSKPLPQRVAQSIESSNKVSEAQVCESFRQWWYATKNTQTIIRCTSHQTQYNPYCPVLNPYQPQHVCPCHIRKTNQVIFKDWSNESPIQQYQTRWMRSPRNTCHRFQQVYSLEASSLYIFRMAAPSQHRIEKYTQIFEAWPKSP
jgi:hypothetical protein